MIMLFPPHLGQASSLKEHQVWHVAEVRMLYFYFLLIEGTFINVRPLLVVGRVHSLV